MVLPVLEVKFAQNWDAYNPLGEVEAIPGLKLATNTLRRLVIPDGRKFWLHPVQLNFLSTTSIS